MSDDSANTDGKVFGKPVLDFKYPESSLFITENNFIGCCILPTKLEDAVFVAHRVHPLVCVQIATIFVSGAFLTYMERCMASSRTLRPKVSGYVKAVKATGFSWYDS